MSKSACNFAESALLCDRLRIARLPRRDEAARGLPRQPQKNCRFGAISIRFFQVASVRHECGGPERQTRKEHRFGESCAGPDCGTAPGDVSGVARGFSLWNDTLRAIGAVTMKIKNAFRVFRAARLARAAGIDPAHVHAGMNPFEAPAAYTREFAAIVKMWALAGRNGR